MGLFLRKRGLMGRLSAAAFLAAAVLWFCPGAFAAERAEKAGRREPGQMRLDF